MTTKKTTPTETVETTEIDRFADARETAQRNHDAELARNDELTAKEDTTVKSAIEARPEVDESKNPEQVKVSSKFPEAK